MIRYGLFTAVFLWIGIVSGVFFQERTVEAIDGDHDASVDTAVQASKSGRFRVHLYFADPDEPYLKAEERIITVSSDSVIEKARGVINALIEGPRSSLGRTLPEQTRLRALFVTKNGVALVDFDRNIVEGHPKGTSLEVLSIFSVVNTLALNFSEIEAVKILVGGREERTLSGHVELRFPFQPNLLMIK